MTDMTQHDESIEESGQPIDGEQGTESPDAADSPAADDVLPWRWSIPAKIAFILTGVILPVICFAVYAEFGEDPKWQSGELSAYAQLLLMTKPTVAFCPLLLYSMISMTLMVGWAEWAMRRFWVRFGIYTGVVLTVQYFLLLAISLEGGCVPFIFFVPFGALFIWMMAWVITYFFLYNSPRDVVLKWVIAAFLVFALVGFYVCISMVAIRVPLIFATPWAIIAYGAMGWYILNRPGTARWQFSLAQLLALVFWVAAYCSAWRWSIKLMLIEYAKLPTAKPDDCYVSTAAARGHRWLVRAEPLENSSNNTLLVNDQMRYLKAAELALAATCRPAHRACRACYNRLGPVLASMLVLPVLADLAYLALKPAEWAARIVLAAVLSGEGRLIRRLYRD